MRGQSRHSAEECIHCPKDQLTADAAQACGWHMKIGDQPVRLRSRCCSDAGDDLLQLICPEAIEKEVGNNQVMGFTDWRPMQDISMHKFHVGCVQVVAGELAAGLDEHLLAPIHTSDSRVWKAAATFDEAATVAFAQQ